MTLLGLLGGVLVLNHQMLVPLPWGEHMFSGWQHWAFLLLGLVAVFVLRGLIYVLLRGLVGVSIRQEVLVRRNPAWGIIDAGLIFGLFLILIALIA